MMAWLASAKSAISEEDVKRLGILGQVAANFAGQAEAESAKLNSENWKRWAGADQKTASGKAVPSKEAYRWAKAPTGWIMPIMGLASKEDEVPDEDPLSYDDLPSELSHGKKHDGIGQDSELLVPLGPQAEVDTTADWWAKLWK